MFSWAKIQFSNKNFSKKLGFFRASCFGYRVKGVCPLLLPLVSLQKRQLLWIFDQIGKKKYLKPDQNITFCRADKKGSGLVFDLITALLVFAKNKVKKWKVLGLFQQRVFLIISLEDKNKFFEVIWLKFQTSGRLAQIQSDKSKTLSKTQNGLICHMSDTFVLTKSLQKNVFIFMRNYKETLLLKRV
jgi:hypothetical protein